MWQKIEKTLNTYKWIEWKQIDEFEDVLRIAMDAQECVWGVHIQLKKFKNSQLTIY